MDSKRLGIGFIGSGFITRFHIQSMVGVRDGDVRGVWSPNAEHADSAAALARTLDVGDARAFPSIEAMIRDPSIKALWLCGPNHRRVENIEASCTAVRGNAGVLLGLACEKPLARTVSEAKHIRTLVSEAGLPHGYLENQLFAPAVNRGRELLWRRGAALTGRPYLARAAEEHSGPHTPWFWRGDLQGGGVLNDMMCHSIEVVRHLLTAPGGAGLRLSVELLGPEYSMSLNSLDSGLRLFFSRAVQGPTGEDLVEKQNAEIGLMPVVVDEATEYGYTAENRHMARAFLRGQSPDVTFDDGVEVVELLMSAYMSAEQGQTLSLRPDGLDSFVPAVARGAWGKQGAD